MTPIRSPKPRSTKNPHVWSSRLSCYIALSVFLTIMVVQSAILVVTLKKYETQQLAKIWEIGRSAISPLIEDTRGNKRKSPITAQRAKMLFETTSVQGLSIYDMDRHLLAEFGKKTTLIVDTTYKNVNPLLSDDKTRYDIIYKPESLLRPYIIVAQMDSSQLSPLIMDYIKNAILISLLLSAFVTCILMIFLGKWLLEPILILRNNVVNAARNPENPNIQFSLKETRDEIGLMSKAVNNLIRQNASNLIKLQSQAENKIHKLAYYDPLTNLPNRTLFVKKLDEAIKNDVLKNDGRLAVLSIDLDHFKDINDTMGHEIGDRLLEAVGQRLTNSTPDDAVIARASADEFIVMTHIDKGIQESSDVVERIFTALEEPISIMQEKFQIRVSIGVSHSPDDGTNPGNIIKNADIALSRSKQEGRDTVRYYSEDFDRAVQARFQILRDLRVAMDENQLQVFYHPQFDLKTREMIGVEALIRWWKPDSSQEGGHFISPVDFIPVAEQAGLIVPIGEWVLREACRANKMWQDMGLPPFKMAVNLSPIQFSRDDIVKTVLRALDETGLDAKWLELEVTESVFMEDIDKTIETLQQLHNLGSELAIDDFGTGYSSLSYLRLFPIDRLKVDQSFIKNALTNTDDMTIAKTIINLGHSLGLKVIAEGVETQEHEDFLIKEGCDEVQGFKYTKPIPGDQLLHFAQNYKKDLKAVT